MQRQLRLSFSVLLMFLCFSFPLYAQLPFYPEIHCKHFIYGYPTGTPATNDLIIRNIYALSSNDTTKMADWVAYRLDKEIISGNAETTRNWKTDPWLEEKETLEPDDYKNAYEKLKIDRGHQAPLAAFKGTKYWDETNYLSNITPQKSELNQGSWKRLEEKERGLANASNIIYVMTGPLYEKDILSLPCADEPHRVPSSYWKIIILPGKSINSLQVAAFVFNQDTPRDDKVIDHISTINEIEKRSGLDFLRELPDGIEEKIESSNNEDWVKVNFN